MALHFYWRAESATLTTDVDYSSDMIGNNSIGFTFSPTAARVGTNGLVSTSGIAGSVYFATGDIFPNYTEIQGSSGSLGYWVRCVSAIPGNSVMMGLRAYTDTASNSLSIEGSTGGTCKLHLGNTYLPLTYALSTNTWYYVVARWDIPNNKRAIELYDTDLTLLDSASDTTTSLASAFTSAPVSFLQCGQRASTATDIHTDNFIVSNNYDAAIVANALITDKDSYIETLLVKKLKMLAHASAASATGIEGVVLNSTRDTVIGEFSGKSFEASLESGKAVLKIPVADFGGTSLTTSDTPLAQAKNTTKTTGLVSCTVIEE